MIPSLHMLESLPHTTSDKIDRNALPDHDFDSSYQKLDITTGRLKEIHRLAAEIMRTTPIDPDANLLEIANSVDLVVLASRMEQQLGISFELEKFFTNPSLRTILEFEQITPKQSPGL